MLEVVLAFIKTGFGSIFILLLGVLGTKIFAFYLGPEGVGLFSLLRAARDTFFSLTSFNGGTALVQGLASRQGIFRKRYGLVVLIIMVLDTVVVIPILIIFAPQIASSVFHRSDPVSVAYIRWLTVPVVLDTILNYLTDTLTGYRAIGRLVLVQLISAIVTAGLAYPVTLLVKSGHSIAFIGMMAASSFMGIWLAFEFVRRAKWLPLVGKHEAEVNRATLIGDGKYFLSFAFTMFVVGLANTWTILAVRSAITAAMGLSAAGVFDVAWTLSMMYVSLALSSFASYYLPKFAQSTNDEDRRQIITRIFRMALIIIVPIITAIILFKPLIVKILYSAEFISSLQIIRWMLMGDYLKTTTWVFGVTITASADKKVLLWTELSWQAGFLLLSLISLYIFKSIAGIGSIFVILNLGHLCYTTYYVHSRFGFRLSRSLVLQWLGGLALLLSLSTITWNSLNIQWIVILIGGGFVILYVALFFTADERTQLLRMVNQRFSRK